MKNAQVHKKPNTINKLHLFSPAKLNIGLSVVGRKKNGLHLIESLFWPIDFGDKIEIQVRNNKTKPIFRIIYSNLFQGKKIPQKNNTLKKAIQFLPANITLQKIILKKSIPTQSGLGGGSSNAGTILSFIRNLFPNTPIEQLSQLIGADVSFFLKPVPSWVSGTGEIIKRLTTHSRHFRKISFLLVIPPFGASTRDIYYLFKKSTNTFSSSTNFFHNRKLNQKTFLQYLQIAKNDLEPIVIQKFPLLAKVLERLKETTPLFTSITGSGSTCFAIYKSIYQAKKAAKDLNVFLRKNKCRPILARTYTY